LPPNFELQQLQRCNSEGATTREIIFTFFAGVWEIIINFAGGMPAKAEYRDAGITE